MREETVVLISRLAFGILVFFSAVIILLAIWRA